MRPTRIVAVASAGGHWVQLMRLQPAWRGLDTVYISTDPGLQTVLDQRARDAGEAAPRLHVVVEANRWHKLRLLRQVLQLTLLMLRLRPSHVISTGAAPGYFALRIGRLLGARTVWIDSIANAEEMSLSGRRIGPHADLWLTQWPHLARPEGPSYIGSVL